MRLLMLLMLALVLGGCGDSSDPPAKSQGLPVPGGGLTVAEALQSDVEGPLAVRGSLVAVDGETRLCDALAESYPPQCGGASLRVLGLDWATVPGQTSPDGRVRWAEQVSLLGAVAGGTLTVSDTAK